jgi:poly(3-hydroxybutyrate) depolymerase
VVTLRRAVGAAALAALLPGVARSAEPKIEKRTVTSRGKPRAYYLYVPSSVSAERPAPLLLALHGSGRNGLPILEKWKDLADKEGIALAGPDAIEPARWASPEDGPLFLRDVVEDIRARHPIDGRRLYLFGHSAGAVFGLQMACLESEYFAAAVLHAGAIEEPYYSIFDFAARKIPIAIVIGPKDQFFPMSVVRPTADALKARGFPAVLHEIAGHDHNYYGKSKEINAWAWAFLSPVRLAEDAKYRVYADP